MRILDRYVTASVVKVFVTCLATFFFLYIIIDVVSLLDDILKQKVALVIIAEYYISFLPVIFVQVTPFCCLLAAMFTFGSLNRNNELIAMRAAGMSILQITRPVLIFGILISLLVFWVNDRLAPSAGTTAQKLRQQVESGSKRAKEREKEIIPNLAIYGLKNRLFFANSFSYTTATLEGIIILEHDRRQNVTKKIVAAKGVYAPDTGWIFYQSISYDLDENGQVIGEAHYLEEEKMQDITETPHDFLSQRQRPDTMTIAQLKDYIDKLKSSGAITVIRNLKVDLYRKFAEPFTSLIIILLGIPFALKIRNRGANLASVGFSIILGFLYYVVNAVGIALGKGGILMPGLSASLAHILALIVSFYHIRSIS
jgi:lipopolysaccharide export system permease protein